MLLKSLTRISLCFSLTVAASFAQANDQVLLKTSMGNIVIALDNDKAPVSVQNFLQYVNSGFYNGTTFHRVMNGFMIQGGGYTADFSAKDTKAPIINESKNGLKNDTYTIAMARTSAPNSATSQFFINVADNAMLNYPNPDGVGYAVFGKVIQGQNIVDQIKAVKTGNKGMYQNVPLQPVVIQSATVVRP